MISFSELIEHMSLPQKGLWIIMAILSIWTIAIVFERFFRFRKAKSSSYNYVIALRDSLANKKIDEALQSAKDFTSSPVANVVAAGLASYKKAMDAMTQNGPEDVGEFDVVEAVERSIDRSKERESAGLRKGLGGLATVASIAPFVGLLGTVIGIIAAFSSMSGGSATLDKVGPGIAEALWATAFGLAIAIPAAMVFNYFTTKADEMIIDMNEVSSELVDYVLREGRA